MKPWIIKLTYQDSYGNYSVWYVTPWDRRSPVRSQARRFHYKRDALREMKTQAIPEFFGLAKVTAEVERL